MFRQIFAVSFVFLWEHTSLCNYYWRVECSCLSYFLAFPFTFPQNDLLKSSHLTVCSLTCTLKWVVLFRTNSTLGKLTGLLFLKCPGLFNRTRGEQRPMRLQGRKVQAQGIRNLVQKLLSQLCSSRVSPCMWRFWSWWMAPMLQDATAFSCAMLGLGIGWTFVHGSVDRIVLKPSQSCLCKGQW